VARRDEIESLTTEEAFAKLTVDRLKPLARLLVEKPPTRKGELVKLLARPMQQDKRVRELYDRLDDLQKAAVQEATHDPHGRLDRFRFEAKYGQEPDFGREPDYLDYRREDQRHQPTLLRLFFPQYDELPTDLRNLLLAFVPKPRPVTVASQDELPAKVRPPWVKLGSDYYDRQEPDEEELRVRETGRDALHDVHAVLRLIDAGSVRVGERTRRPGAAALQAIAQILQGGDFYTGADQEEYEHDPAADLAIKSFGWPMLLQGAGLVETAGNRLQLTPPGRKAATRPPHEVIRGIWMKWKTSTLLDEFNRISEIKGQGKGRLTALAARRARVIEGLAECPAGKWLAVEELFRILKTGGGDFQVSREPWDLYIGEQQYGSLGYDARHAWETLQGRYVLAFLFEYTATLGVIDVGYITPQGARNDFRDRWGTDDLSCLSRYDGLLFFRINRLGAWCLGLADGYEPEPVTVEPVLKVLANYEVVTAGRPLSPADRLLLERFAEQRSEAVWRLDAAKIRAAVEEGLPVRELTNFLKAKSEGSLPQTVEVFLADLEAKSGQLRDLGAARLIECADTTVAQMLANDRKLKKLCQLAGEKCLVFRAADEAAVRRTLRELGYVVPPT
jgi:hypothetical protein